MAYWPGDFALLTQGRIDETRLYRLTPTRLTRAFCDLMKIDPEEELAIFTQALKLPSRDRAAFLERVCGGDGPLRRRLEELLRAHDRLGNFLEEPPNEERASESD